jgi:LacI family transcriptional regulator
MKAEEPRRAGSAGEVTRAAAGQPQAGPGTGDAGHGAAAGQPQARPGTGDAGHGAARQQPPSAPADGKPDTASPVTLYDVARLASVSIATVSRVVHGQDLVRDSTRARVLEVIDRLGYVPDGAAQSLSRRRKDVIGLVCVEREVPKQYDVESMALLFYDEILRGVEALIRNSSRSLLITYLQEDTPGKVPRLLSLSGKVDGLLIGEGVVPSTVLARLSRRIPVVVISGNPSERAADIVTADNRSGAAALITHLVEEHGLRRLYHVEGPPTAPDARERSLALAQVLKDHPGSRLVGSWQGSFSVQGGEEAGEMLLAMPAEKWPDAVVCANDQTAIGVLQVFARAGVRVPEQVAVVGFDDIYPGSLFKPSLTTVHQPMRLLGERACIRLLNRIANPGMRQKVELLPTELVLRSSCGCPPGTEIRRVVEPSRPARSPRQARRAAPAAQKT